MFKRAKKNICFTVFQNFCFKQIKNIYTKLYKFDMLYIIKLLYFTKMKWKRRKQNIKHHIHHKQFIKPGSVESLCFYHSPYVLRVAYIKSCINLYNTFRIKSFLHLRTTFYTRKLSMEGLMCMYGYKIMKSHSLTICKSHKDFFFSVGWIKD